MSLSNGRSNVFGKNGFYPLIISNEASNSSYFNGVNLLSGSKDVYIQFNNAITQ